MNTKVADVGIITVRNEAEDIEGWAKEALFFCNKVVCSIDPETTDDTEQILREKFPSIIIEFQDRTLGDSDDKIKGPTKNMICHQDFTRLIKKYTVPDNWILELAPDERFAPKDFSIIIDDVQKARSNPSCDGLVFRNYYTFRHDLEHVIDWYSYFQWGALNQVKFWKIRPESSKNGPPHSGHQGWVKRVFETVAGFYHFCYMKKSRIPFTNWRDEQMYADFQIVKLPFKDPFVDWKSMPELNFKGELIEIDKII